jgi:hypothetical protein
MLGNGLEGDSPNCLYATKSHAGVVSLIWRP